MSNRPKPDDRSDNVERIQRNINNTIVNYRETEDLINNTDNPKQKKDLEEKNKRREQSLKGMKRGIREEALNREKGFK